MKILTIALIALVGSKAVCQQLALSTQSDSARFYYYEGWRQVMDEGNYTYSEKAYRMAYRHDPGFLMGLCLLGRISTDNTERANIETQVKLRRDELSGDERLLLENFLGLLTLSNLRTANPSAADTLRISVIKNCESILMHIVHRYPDEIYYKSEYIEVLHYNHGPSLALDSLKALTTNQEKENAFLLGYAASLQAELGNFTEAQRLAIKLEEKFNGRRSPKPYVVNADISFKMNNFDKAQEYITQALLIDPGSLDAQRLKKKIENVK